MEYQRHYVNEQKLNCNKYLAYSMFVYNNLICTAIGYKDYIINHTNKFRRTIKVSYSLNHPHQPYYKYDNNNMKMPQKFQEDHELTRKSIIDKKHKSKITYDQNQHAIDIYTGNKVLIKDHTHKRKLSLKWKEPYIVKNVHANKNVSIQRNKNIIKFKKLIKNISRINHKFMNNM